MALTGGHTVGTGDHIGDHNLIDAALTAETARAQAAEGTLAPNKVPVDVAPRSARYDPRWASYNVTAPKLQSVQAVLSKALTAVGYYEILCIGDSTTWGYAGNAADPRVIAFPPQLAGFLSRSGTPDGGTGWVFTNPQGDNPDSRWALSGGWSSGSTGINYLQTTTNGATATFTSDHVGTILDFAYFDNSGPFTYSLDGAAPVTVTPVGTNTVKTVSLTGLTGTSHSLLITATSTAFTYALCARVRQATGLAVTNAGIPGSTTTHWLPSDASFNHAWAEVVTALGAITTYGATFISLGLNEQGPAAANFQANLQAIAAAAPGTVILWIPPTPAGAAGPWQAFRQAYYNVADNLNIPLIDVGDAQGVWNTANANGLRYDSLHPNASGYAQIASLFANLLLPFGTVAGDRTWQAPTYQNGWVNYPGGGFASGGFRKDPHGFVHLRGLLQGGTATAGTTMFTLPAGYRPAAQEVFGTASNDAFGEVRVQTSGAVNINAGSANWLSLSGITFLAEN